MKVKDYVTWGEVDDNILKEVIKTHGKLEGENLVTDKYIKSNSDFKNISDFASSIVNRPIWCLIMSNFDIDSYKKISTLS